MLHKNFKAAKCKTSVKLAASRIKLLKNKREAHVNQLKREVAQLLETGQDQTARIRVEHVIREEKTMSAYSLIELYCELIVARLQMIESQKNCPIDLKEAISSVIFASPRCADVPELLDVSKHFKAKYGKEFVTSALELRPNCGVNTMVAEKLSAKTPDIETKVKMLTSIATEQGIKWEPKAFEETLQKPDVDLMKGSSSFENASERTTEATKPEPILTSSQKDELNKRTSGNEVTGSSASSSSFAVGNTKSADHRPESRTPERRHEGPKTSHYSREEVTATYQQNWSMDFKDAASAAQAAAESAERASMAARAAAELASRENGPGQSKNGTVFHDPIHKNDALNKRVYRMNMGSKGHQEDITMQDGFSQKTAKTDDLGSVGRRSSKSFSSPSNQDNYDFMPDMTVQEEAAPSQRSSSKKYEDKHDRRREEVMEDNLVDEWENEPTAGTVQEEAAPSQRGSSKKYEDKHDRRREEVMKDNSVDEWENALTAGYASHSSESPNSESFVLGHQTSDGYDKRSFYEEESVTPRDARSDKPKRADIQKSNHFSVKLSANDFEDHDVVNLHNQKQQDTFDNKNSETGTKKVDNRSWDRQQSSRDHSVVFDDSGSDNGDHLDLDDFANDIGSSSQDQGSKFSDFPLHNDPWHHPSKNSSSMEAFSIKKTKSVVSEGNITKTVLPELSDDISPVTYDSDGAHSEKNDSHLSPLWGLGLTGGLRNKVSPPPYVGNPLWEVPTSHKETVDTTTSSTREPDHLKPADDILSSEIPSPKANKQNLYRQPRSPKPRPSVSSSDSDSSEEESPYPTGSKGYLGSSIRKQSTDDRPTSIHKTHQDLSYKRPGPEASKKSNRVAISVDYSDLSGRGTASSLLSKNSDDFVLTSQRPHGHTRFETASAFDSFEQDNEKQYAKDSDRRSSIPDFDAGNDGEHSKSKIDVSTVTDGKSRRTRVKPSKSKFNILLEARDTLEVVDNTSEQRKLIESNLSAPESLDSTSAKEYNLDMNRRLKIPQSRSPIRRSSGTLPNSKDFPQKGILSSKRMDNPKSYGLQPPESSGEKPSSKFAAPSSWREDISSEDDLPPKETLSIEKMDSPKSSGLQRPEISDKKPVSKFAAPSAWRENMSIPEASKSTQSALAQTSLSQGKETPNSPSSTSNENPKVPLHVHPKLPDHDKFTAYFQALRSNKRK